MLSSRPTRSFSILLFCKVMQFTPACFLRIMQLSDLEYQKALATAKKKNRGQPIDMRLNLSFAVAPLGYFFTSHE